MRIYWALTTFNFEREKAVFGNLRPRTRSEYSVRSLNPTTKAAGAVRRKDQGINDQEAREVYL